MAQAKIEKKVTITLELTEQEARYIKGLVQNPIGEPDSEDPTHKIMRKNIWDSLESVVPHVTPRKISNHTASIIPRHMLDEGF